MAGANNRTNTIYLDGVRQSDDFGLNSGGYPTQRSPFSIDTVAAFNFDVAPYDVRYGDFEGGVLNVVTKSGSNDFHGSAFWERDSNYLAGHKIGAGTCGANAGKNVYLYQVFKPGNIVGTVITPSSPPTPLWVVKFGARFSSSRVQVWSNPDLGRLQRCSRPFTLAHYS